MKPTSIRTWWRQGPPPSASPLQKSWLMRAGALTKGLREVGPLSLEVLHESPGALTTDEATGLLLARRSPVWIREIVMSIDGTHAVVARSVAPLAATHGVWQGIRGLRTRPLADILYHDPAIRRSSFQVARVRSPMPMLLPVRRIMPQLQGSAFDVPPMLARRSVFWRSGAPLLVAECFLPAFWEKVRAKAQT